MKRHISLLILAVAAIALSACATTSEKSTSATSPVPTASAGPSENVEQALTKLEQDWAAAAVKADAAASDRIVADDWVGITSTGQTQTKAEIMNELKSGTYKATSMNVDNIKVRVLGDTAVVTLVQTEKSQYKGKDSSGVYLFTDVWAKRNGKWQVINSHGSKSEQAKKS